MGRLHVVHETSGNVVARLDATVLVFVRTRPLTVVANTRKVITAIRAWHQYDDTCKIVPAGSCSSQKTCAAGACN